MKLTLSSNTLIHGGLPLTFHLEVVSMTFWRVTKTVLARLTAGVAFACFVSSSSFAADVDKKESAAIPSQQFDEARFGDVRDRLSEWQVTIGGGALVSPEYEGSDKFVVKPFPLLTAKFGERITVDPTGVTIDTIQWHGLRLGIIGGYEIGRKEDDSDYLRGLGDVDAGGVIGGIVSYDSGPFQAYATLTKTIGGSEGLTSTFGLGTSTQYDRFLLAAQVYGTWADDNHMESYFGITPAQSARSGLPEYDAKAGLKRVDIKASATYVINENWLITGSGGVGLLMGSAKDSPVVKDDVQPFALVGVSYRF